MNLAFGDLRHDNYKSLQVLSELASSRLSRVPEKEQFDHIHFLLIKTELDINEGTYTSQHSFGERW